VRPSRHSAQSLSERTRGGDLNALALISSIVAAVGIASCGTSDYPAEDSSLSDHMTFVSVVADGSVEPAVITGEIRYTGNGSATQVAIAAKASGDSNQVSLADMSPGETRSFRVSVNNPSGANQFQMHVVWVESGRTGRKSY
jgi:hypothetical protein